MLAEGGSLPTQHRLFGLSAVSLVILLGAAAKLAVHLLTGSNYGFFVDDLYTIALSKHLALGYVDVPPLTPLLVAAARALFGESLAAMHLLPALAGAATLVCICLMAGEFGGKTFAVGLAALGFLIAPAWLIIDSYLSYDAFDQLLLAAFLLAWIRLLRTGDRRLWLLLGALGGAACLTKMTLLFMGPGFLIGMLLSKTRRDFLTRWPWLGAALVLVLVSPYLAWQTANGWPTLTYWINYGTQRLAPVSIPAFAWDLINTLHPILLPLWLVGLWRILGRRANREYVPLGVAILVTLALLFFLRAKAWMMVALFPPLIAAGAVAVEQAIEGRHWARVFKPSAAAALLVAGAFAAPASLPIVPVESLPAWVGYFDFWKSGSAQTGDLSSAYPLTIALRIGWEELVRDVADVYRELPPEDRARAGIYAFWYGPAGAIDFYGPAYGLPPAVSAHLNYYLWGPGASWEVMIIVTNPEYPLTKLFAECELKKQVDNEYTIALNKLDIHVCRKPVWPLKILWERLRGYY
jgi:4-amino-4-deoxy-L-arabinose transferase-like glycosyltransferase